MVTYVCVCVCVCVCGGGGGGDCVPCLPMLHSPWQGSATPGCTLPHSKAQPLDTGLKKYSLQGVDPRSHLICTPLRRATPPGSP